MTTNLNAKVAIVTGGATLIGAAVVEVLRAAGARVAILTRGTKVGAIVPETTHF